MTDEQVLKTMQDVLCTDFLFSKADILLDKCECVLNEMKQNVTDASELQLRNFNAKSDAILKYRQGKNFQLNKQEKTILEKSAQLSVANEALLRAAQEMKADMKNVAKTKNEKQKQLESLNLEMMTDLKEHNANIQSLEGVRRCVETEIFFYNKFLGIEIRKDTAGGDQLHIQFQVKNQSPKADCKIPVLQKNYGFVFPDGSTASTPAECLAQVCCERKKCCQST